MGVGTSDDTSGHDAAAKTSLKEPGLQLTLCAGDLIVHPAGMSHQNVHATEEYRYLAFFPRDAPPWRTEFGVKEMDSEKIMAETMAVPIPEDPIAGGDGFLRPLWGDAKASYANTSGAESVAS